MVGTPSKKVFCQARRKYDGQPCRAKGILCKNGRWICRYHGGKSTGAKTLEGKLKQYKNLLQYKGKTDEEIKRIIRKDT